MILRLALAAGLLLAASPAWADGTFPDLLERADRDRLRALDETRPEVIEAARQGGASIDVGVLNRVLEGEAQAQSAAALAGDWQCRTLRLGGLLPLTVHGWFRCRITDDPAGLRLEKLGGSQRSSGILYDLGEARLGYAGAEAWGEEPPRRYGEDAERDQVGYLIPLSPDRLRLELPAPRQESRLDILELRRAPARN